LSPSNGIYWDSGLLLQQRQTISGSSQDFFAAKGFNALVSYLKSASKGAVIMDKNNVTMSACVQAVVSLC
jgi:hypothetical protein